MGRPLEDHGVSIVKYDNSGSWKRFAKLFLRKDKDTSNQHWHPTKIAVLRDLDLWPSCAEKKNDGTNPYGFLDRKSPNDQGRGGNLDYWETSDAQQLEAQISARKAQHKKDGEISLERQNVKIFVSDRWTFEFCLARYGLYTEACAALGVAEVNGTEDEKSTYIQSQVSKTDFAYKLGQVLEDQLLDRVQQAMDGVNQGENLALQKIEAARETRARFAEELRTNLPPYIVNAIDFATSLNQNSQDGGGESGGIAA
ncbi:MAG: hypothetical protein B6D72_01385 [gamma proteobacterium symbiont of Ctena orbiculata]|nr:MAG: hypothetical protein B6D72_01385 [gamma proteobacterium symbiont of Ctena orbiculata]